MSSISNGLMYTSPMCADSKYASVCIYTYMSICMYVYISAGKNRQGLFNFSRFSKGVRYCKPGHITFKIRVVQCAWITSETYEVLPFGQNPGCKNQR